MSLRRLIAAAGVAVLLTSGLVASTPSATAHPQWKPWGATHAPDQVLKKGCHQYRYHYRIDKPNWAAEIFLIGPRGKRLMHDSLLAGADPRKGWRRWSTQLCRSSTTFGRHKIKMKITWTKDSTGSTDDNVDGWVKPSYFRLKRR